VSQRNAALAIAIASGLEHIAQGLRTWASAQRDLPDQVPSEPPRTPESDRLLRIREAAQILGVSTSSVYKLIHEGALKTHPLGGRVARSEIERFVREGPVGR
jgi:excisionase family DNA binding protein